MSNEKSYEAHLTSQFEVLWKHLEYHDSNVFKILSIYFGFSGLFIANLDKFKGSEIIAIILVAMASIIFSILLYRTSEVLTQFKLTINKIDDLKALSEDSLKSIPPLYLESKIRTSKVGYVSIPLFAVAVITHLSGIFSS